MSYDQQVVVVVVAVVIVSNLIMVRSISIKFYYSNKYFEYNHHHSFDFSRDFFLPFLLFFLFSLITNTLPFIQHKSVFFFLFWLINTYRNININWKKEGYIMWQASIQTLNKARQFNLSFRRSASKSSSYHLFFFLIKKII